jgi:hypothetical protein
MRPPFQHDASSALPYPQRRTQRRDHDPERRGITVPQLDLLLAGAELDAESHSTMSGSRPLMCNATAIQTTATINRSK